MSMNPIRVTYAASATGVQTALSIDFRDAPAGCSFEVQFDAGASGSVTVETTLDNINDPAITPDWFTSSPAITADARGVIGYPVQFIRLNISSLAGGTLTFKVLAGAPMGDTSGMVPSGGGGASSNVNVAQVGGTNVINGGVAGLLGVGGNVASGAADSGNPIKAGGVYSSTLPTLANGQRSQLQSDDRGNIGVLIKGGASTGADAVSNASLVSILNQTQAASPGTAQPLLMAGMIFNGTSWDRQVGNTTGTIIIPPRGWSYAAATGGIVSSTAGVTIKAAAGAGIRNYLTSITINTDTLGTATELVIRDGAAGTVLWRIKLQTTNPLTPFTHNFNTPLYSTANTLLEVALLTSSTGGVFVNAAGFTAP